MQQFLSRKQVGLVASLATFGLMGFAGNAHAARVELAEWNFNTGTNALDGLFTATDGVQAASSLMTTNISPTFGAIFNTAGTSINAGDPAPSNVGGDAPGNALRIKAVNNAGVNTAFAANTKYLEWDVDTTGFGGLQVSFADLRSTVASNGKDGPQVNRFQYNDGSGFVDAPTGSAVVPGNPSYSAKFFDLSGISTLTNNSNAQFRILFGASQAGGFNQFDNLVVTAVATPEPGTWALFGVGLAAMVVMMRRRKLSDGSQSLAL